MNGMNEENVMDTLIAAHELSADGIQQKALDLLTSRKMDCDKLFDGRTFPPDLWTLITKALHEKVLERM